MADPGRAPVYHHPDRLSGVVHRRCPSDTFRRRRLSGGSPRVREEGARAGGQCGEPASGDIPDVRRASVAAACDQVPAVRAERQAEEPVVVRGPQGEIAGRDGVARPGCRGRVARTLGRGGVTGTLGRGRVGVTGCRGRVAPDLRRGLGAHAWSLARTVAGRRWRAARDQPGGNGDGGRDDADCRTGDGRSRRTPGGSRGKTRCRRARAWRRPTGRRGRYCRRRPRACRPG